MERDLSYNSFSESYYLLEDIEIKTSEGHSLVICVKTFFFMLSTILFEFQVL